jgi:threonine dehydrogenase-like Zn-dependent dehydrogenase
LREAFDLIAGGAVRTAELVSHRLPLARLAEGVALVRRHQALKVYVTP